MKRLVFVPALLIVIAFPAAAQTPATVVAYDFSAVAERVLPAVVTVAVMSDEDATPELFGLQRKSGAKGVDASVAYAGSLDLSPYNGSGSGFVIEHRGRKYAVTNAHVIHTALPDIFSLNRIDEWITCKRLVNR